MGFFSNQPISCKCNKDVTNLAISSPSILSVLYTKISAFLFLLWECNNFLNKNRGNFGIHLTKVTPAEEFVIFIKRFVLH